MSLTQANTPETKSQTGFIINELVEQKLKENLSPFTLLPLTVPQTDMLINYYGKPVSVTTEESKTIRKLARLFNSYAEKGYIPPVTNLNLVIEWGKADAMRQVFFPMLGAYVHAKEFLLGKADEKVLPQKRVFVTGTCIYGKNGVIGKTDKGKTLSLVDPYITPNATYEEYGCIKELEFQDEFHIYEVVEALSRGNFLNGVKADKINFNVPVIPYVLYAKEAISRGIMDENLMGVWVAQLQKRASQLVTYEQSICNGVVVPVDPLYPYLDYICVPQTSIERLSKFLSEKDTWWKRYLDQSPPQKFADFGYASYMKVYYDQLGDKDSARIVYAVEDQTEMQILLGTKRLIDSGCQPKPNEKSRILGLYPFTPVIFPNTEGEANATFFANENGLRAPVEQIFSLCAKFAEPDMIEKAKSAYTAIQANGNAVNTTQFNLV